MPAPPLIHFVTLGRFHNIFALQFSLLQNGGNSTIYLIGLLQSLKKSYEQDPILTNGYIRASLFYYSLECKWSRTFFILCFLPPLPLSLAFLLTQPNLLSRTCIALRIHTSEGINFGLVQGKLTLGEAVCGMWDLRGGKSQEKAMPKELTHHHTMRKDRFFLKIVFIIFLMALATLPCVFWEAFYLCLVCSWAYGLWFPGHKAPLRKKWLICRTLLRP